MEQVPCEKPINYVSSNCYYQGYPQFQTESNYIKGNETIFEDSFNTNNNIINYINPTINNVYETIDYQHYQPFNYSQYIY